MKTALNRWQVRSAIALMLVVLGGRLWLVERAGSDLPLWDQWWSDFGTVVLPLSQGTLDFSSLAKAHNEHHLFFQRVILTSLMAVSGRWEPRDALIVSALARAIGLAVIFLVLARHQSMRTRGILLVLLATLGAMPVGTFNLLSGFQIQFFIGEPLAIVALALLFDGRLTVERLAAAMSLLLLALLNMATPLITSLGAIAVFGLRIALKRGERSRNLAAASALGIFVLFTFATTPRTTYLQARSFSEFAPVFVRLVSWPAPDFPILGALALVPPVLLLRRLVREPFMPGSSWFVFALALTAWIQNGAIAFARARSGQTAFPQYLDGLWLGHLISLLALAEVLRPKAGKSAILQARACAVWGLCLFTGLVADASLRGLPLVERVREVVARRQPAFADAMARGDLSAFEGETQEVDQMMRKGEYQFFDDPTGRFAIPAPVYSRLADDNTRRSLVPFLPAILVSAEPSWISRAMRLVSRSAPLTAGIGLVLLVLSLREAFGRTAENSPRTGIARQKDAEPEG